jgi:sulfate adenylyltransferase subunit 1 (EFTu-like GTPase family)
MSALAGDMVVERGNALSWYRGPALLELLESLEPADEAASLPTRFPVQLVIRPGAGTDFRGYAGRLESGVLRPGDEVLVLPSGQRTRVAEILVLGTPREIAMAGDSVTLTLADEVDVSRGDLIAAATSAPSPVKALDARVCWVDTAPLDAARKYLLKHATRTVRAKVSAVVDRVDIHTLERVPTSTVSLNDIAHLRLALAQPIAADRYVENRATGAFILVDELTNQTVAAGMIE